MLKLKTVHFHVYIEKYGQIISMVEPFVIFKELQKIQDPNSRAPVNLKPDTTYVISALAKEYIAYIALLIAR